MNPETQTTLFTRILQNLIEKIMLSLHEQLKENGQLQADEVIAGPVPETPLECDQILEGGKFCDDVNGEYLPEDLVLASRREEIDWVHSEGIYEAVPMLECGDAGMRPLDLIWVTLTCLWIRHARKFDSRLCAREYKTKKQGRIQRALTTSQLFCGMSLLEALKVLVSIMMSVSLSNKGKH